MLRKNGWSISSHHTKSTHSQNGWSSKMFLQIVRAAKWQCDKYVPPNSSDDLCLPFCLILRLWSHLFTERTQSCLLRLPPPPWNGYNYSMFLKTAEISINVVFYCRSTGYNNAIKCCTVYLNMHVRWCSWWWFFAVGGDFGQCVTTRTSRKKWSIRRKQTFF